LPVTQIWRRLRSGKKRAKQRRLKFRLTDLSHCGTAAETIHSLASESFS
jgi:hypothetical protein